MKKLILSPLLAILFVGCATAETDLSAFLDRAGQTVNNANIVEIARLKPTNVSDVQKAALRTPDTIAGFPIDGVTREIDAKTIAHIGKTILNPANYADLMQRCSNTYLMGIRFRAGEKVVEFAYSQPCMQAFWAMEVDGQVNFVGAVLGPDYGKAILELQR